MYQSSAASSGSAIGDGLATEQPDEGRGHVVAAGRVEERRDHREATGVDLGDVWLPGCVRFQVELKTPVAGDRSACTARVQMATTPGSTPNEPGPASTTCRWAGRRRRSRTDARRSWSAADWPSRHSDSSEVTARQVLGEREAWPATPRISRPVLDPGARLGGRETGIAPREPLPDRIRHHRRPAPEASQRSRRARRGRESPRTSAARARRTRAADWVRYLSWQSRSLRRRHGTVDRQAPRGAADSSRTSSSCPGMTSVDVLLLEDGAASAEGGVVGRRQQEVPGRRRFA